MLIVVPLSVLVPTCITWLIGILSTYRYGSYVCMNVGGPRDTYDAYGKLLQQSTMVLPKKYLP